MRSVNAYKGRHPRARCTKPVERILEYFKIERPLIGVWQVLMRVHLSSNSSISKENIT